MEIESMNTRLLTRSPLAVKIIKVESPTRFWVQLKNSHEDFKEMLDDLARRLGRRGRQLRQRPDHVREGELVAVKEDRGWQRGLVTRHNRDGTALIALRDWGRTIERSICEVYLLEDRFRELPWQGIPCGLAYTGPISGNTWSRKVRELTKLLLERQEGWITILGTLKDEAALVKVKVETEQKNNDINLKEILILLGYARDYEQIRVGAYPSV